MMYYLTGFSDVCIFLLSFGNDIIMTSFLVTWFSNLRNFVELTKGYQLAKFQRCRLSVKFYKNTDDVIMTSFHIFGIRSFHIL